MQFKCQVCHTLSKIVIVCTYQRFKFIKELINHLLIIPYGISFMSNNIFLSQYCCIKISQSRTLVTYFINKI